MLSCSGKVSLLVEFGLILLAVLQGKWWDKSTKSVCEGIIIVMDLDWVKWDVKM